MEQERKEQERKEQERREQAKLEQERREAENRPVVKSKSVANRKIASVRNRLVSNSSVVKNSVAPTANVLQPKRLLALLPKRKHASSRHSRLLPIKLLRLKMILWPKLPQRLLCKMSLP